jgi:hypothetical protein
LVGTNLSKAWLSLCLIHTGNEMSAEQLRAAFEAWAQRIGFAVTGKFAETSQVICSKEAFLAGYQAGRAALASPEVAELRKDAERLDWLDARAHCADWVEGEPTKRVIRAEDGQVHTGDTWREAIDAAMEEQK